MIRCNQNDWDRFYALRAKVFDAIKKVIEDPEDDGYHKSYEGAMDVTFGFDNYFETDDVTSTWEVRIELHCYLLVDGRHAEWTGKTFSEALDGLENWIDNLEENDD